MSMSLPRNWCLLSGWYLNPSGKGWLQRGSKHQLAEDSTLLRSSAPPLVPGTLVGAAVVQAKEQSVGVLGEG